MTAEIISLRLKVAKPLPRRPYRKYGQRRRYEYGRAFGRRLRYARAQLGISEVEAATAFGVSISTYRRYEAGHAGNRGQHVADFGYAFNISLRWLFGCRGSAAERPRFRLRAV
jgi:ribosome-binding protein aMBF1 (putative translation factor)